MDPIRDGVFFAAPPPLPRGRHAVAREVVLERQRERLMIAATELIADRGARSIGVREIAEAAGVSRAAFYDCFEDKDDCFQAAYGRFIEVLTLRMVEAIADRRPWGELVREVIGGYLRTLSQDLVVARAFQVEMDALGRWAREQRREALTAMAVVLKERRDAWWPGSEAIPMQAYLGCIYATRQLACDVLDAGGDPASLLDTAAAWVAELLRAPIEVPASGDSL